MMTKTLAIVLIVAAAQVQANGFRPWDNRGINDADVRMQTPAKTDHAPWYFAAQRQSATSIPDVEQDRVARLGPYYFDMQMSPAAAEPPMAAPMDPRVSMDLTGKRNGSVKGDFRCLTWGGDVAAVRWLQGSAWPACLLPALHQQPRGVNVESTHL